jgi:hypothetical protein
MLSEGDELVSVQRQAPSAGADSDALSPCHRRYSCGATCDVANYRRYTAIYSCAGGLSWCPSDASSKRHPSSGAHRSPHLMTSNTAAATVGAAPTVVFGSGYAVAVTTGQPSVAVSTLVESEEDRTLSSSSSSSPQQQQQQQQHAPPHHGTNGTRSMSYRHPSSSTAAAVAKPMPAARPTDLDLGSTVYDDGGQYRRRTYSMPTGGGHVHGAGSTTAAARSAACRRAYSRKWRDEQQQQQQQQQQRVNGNGFCINSSDVGGAVSSSVPNAECVTEYVRVRSVIMCNERNRRRLCHHLFWV